MKYLTGLTLGLATLAMAGVASMAAAEPAMQDMGSMREKAAQPGTKQKAHVAYGTLKAVNPAEGKVQLAHQAIASLSWPAMTMWFDLRGPLPDNVKPGDAVRFELTEASRGKWVVTRIEPR